MKQNNIFLCQKLFLSVFYIGFVKKASGTFGSLVAAPMAFLIGHYISNVTLFLLAIFIGIISIKVIDKYQEVVKKHDASEIVIDELVGMWIAISLVPISIVSVVLCFFLFRFFDIYKPSMIGKVDKNMKNGLGVVLDDVLAGGFAGILGAIILSLERFIV